jgi:hypothetical protein
MIIFFLFVHPSNKIATFAYIDRYEIGKACRWFHWIDLKFFNLNVAFTTDFLKMAQIRVRFSPGFPPGAGFHGEEFAPAWFETIP